MRYQKLLALMLACLTVCMVGCKQQQNDPVSAILFERGHGSAWGNQFSITVTADRIVTATYLTPDTLDPVTVENIPITADHWDTLCDLLDRLPLREARTNRWERNKLDGGEFRKLTLQQGGKKTRYTWPETPEAAQLEQYLEALLRQSIQPTQYDTGRFCVTVPVGWTAFAVEDVFADTPGAINGNRLNIIRGGTDPLDVKTNIYLLIDYFGPEEPMEVPSAEGLEDVRQITPFRTGEHLWRGFAGTDTQGRGNLGTSAVLWTEEGECRYIVAFPLEFNGQTLSLEDPALLAMLASLSPSNAG